MKRAAGLVLAAMLMGCGSEPATQELATKEPPPVPTDGRPVGSVGFDRALTASVTNVKVVLKTSASVDVPVQAYDPMMSGYMDVTCSAGGKECDPYPGSRCGAAGICMSTVTKNAIFYVMNTKAPPLTGLTFPVPCDGKSYAAEIYTATATASGALQLQDMYQAQSVAVSGDCSMITTSPVWNKVAPPSLNVPAVYVGLPAPNDTYAVGVSGDAYPFSSSFTMTATQGVNPPVNGTVSGASAVFNAPSTTDVVDLAGTFRLDDTILFASEAKTPWQWQATAHITPTGTKPISGPPALGAACTPASNVTLDNVALVNATAGYIPTTSISLSNIQTDASKWTVTNHTAGALTGLGVQTWIQQGANVVAGGGGMLTMCGGDVGYLAPGSCTPATWYSGMPNAAAGLTQGAAVLKYDLVCSSTSAVLSSFTVNVQLVP